MTHGLILSLAASLLLVEYSDLVVNKKVGNYDLESVIIIRATNQTKSKTHSSMHFPIQTYFFYLYCYSISKGKAKLCLRGYPPVDW